MTPVSSRASSLGIVARDVHVQYYAGCYGGQPPILGMRMHVLCVTNLKKKNCVIGVVRFGSETFHFNYNLYLKRCGQSLDLSGGTL